MAHERLGIPKDVLKTLQNPELSIAKKMVAFNMLVPGLPADAMHSAAYEKNLELGKCIKALLAEGKIEVTAMDKNSILKLKLC